MKYSELAKVRAKQLLDAGVITNDAYTGNSTKGNMCDSDLHVCWFSICENERNDWWRCERCHKYDPERCPTE